MYPLGISKNQKEYLFATAAPNATFCNLKLYKQSDPAFVKVIPMYKEAFGGGCFSVKLRISQLKEADCYRFETDKGEFVDAYAKKIKGRESFGKSSASVFGMMDLKEIGWDDDVEISRDFSDMILYKLHVRGFTMDVHSNVRHKGTYLGIVEKIPYLKELGINTILLMPCVEFNEIVKEPYAIPGAKEKLNYWGYTNDAYYFAPKASYAADPWNVREEFCYMVKECHRAGIEVFMEFYFSSSDSTTLILDCLRYWKTQMHIDGFSFVTDTVACQVVAKDWVMENTKLLASHWDSSLYYDRHQKVKNVTLADCNDEYMTHLRRYLRGEEGQINCVTSQMRRYQESIGNISYITNHNGFTLFDLFSYEKKHNEANQQNNKDGTDYNYSFNCGVEGTTTSKKILQLRYQMMQNAFALLLLGQRTPMILSGDEFANSQMGNNNPYNQDNEIGWVNWKTSAQQKELLDFVKQLIALRTNHPVFHNKEILKGMDYLGCRLPDLSFHGEKVWKLDDSNYSRTFGMLLAGDYAWVKMGLVKDSTFYVISNMHKENHCFDLPTLVDLIQWRLVLTTSPSITMHENQVILPPRSIAVLCCEREK